VVQTEVIGRIEALSAQVAEPLTDVSPEREKDVRPVVGGTSLSAYVTKGAAMYLYSGTLGMVTYDDRVLSNAHVIAMNPATAGFWLREHVSCNPELAMEEGWTIK
jgi:hypothetical protein